MESFTLIPKWVASMGLKANEQIIFSELLLRSRNAGFAWPSIRFLATKIQASIATVYRVLKSLIEKGLIKRVYRFWRGKKRAVYYVKKPGKKFCAPVDDLDGRLTVLAPAKEPTIKIFIRFHRW
jgi:predicted DNA-binding transcriptional regulator